MSDYERLIVKFGTTQEGCPETQEYVIEECAELIQAIQHHRRGRCDIHKVASEMADVICLIEALMYHWNISWDEINQYHKDLIRRYLDKPNDGRHVE